MCYIRTRKTMIKHKNGLQTEQIIKRNPHNYTRSTIMPPSIWCTDLLHIFPIIFRIISMQTNLCAINTLRSICDGFKCWSLNKNGILNRTCIKKEFYLIWSVYFIAHALTHAHALIDRMSVFNSVPDLLLTFSSTIVTIICKAKKKHIQSRWCIKRPISLLFFSCARNNNNALWKWTKGIKKKNFAKKRHCIDYAHVQQDKRSCSAVQCIFMRFAVHYLVDTFKLHPFVGSSRIFAFARHAPEYTI